VPLSKVIFKVIQF